MSEDGKGQMSEVRCQMSEGQEQGTEDGKGQRTGRDRCQKSEVRCQKGKSKGQMTGRDRCQKSDVGGREGTDVRCQKSDVGKGQRSEVGGQPPTHPPCSRQVAAGSYVVPRRSWIGADSFIRWSFLNLLRSVTSNVYALPTL